MKGVQRLQRKIGYVAVLIICLLGLASPAAAVPTLDFAIQVPTSGTISYAGGAAPVVGTGISVNNVTGIGGTPSNNNVSEALSNALLSFTSGNFVNNTGTCFPCASNYAGGGSITLVGGVPGLGIPNGTTLFTGFFDYASIQNTGASADGSGEKIIGAVFQDTKPSTLTGFWGLPGGSIPYLGVINLSFEVPLTNTGAIPVAPTAWTSSSVLSGDITNRVVPEPSTLLLLGSGLFGLGGFGLRRRKG